MTLIVFASLTGVDAVCCPDGCTDEQSQTQQHSPESTRGACLFCLGSVDTARPQQLLASMVAAGLDVPAALPLLDPAPTPADHPPRP